MILTILPVFAELMREISDQVRRTRDSETDLKLVLVKHHIESLFWVQGHVIRAGKGELCTGRWAAVWVWLHRIALNNSVYPYRKG